MRFMLWLIYTRLVRMEQNQRAIQESQDELRDFLIWQFTGADEEQIRALRLKLREGRITLTHAVRNASHTIREEKRQ